MNVSCDVCEYGELGNPCKNTYYCHNPDYGHRGTGVLPMTTNCRYGKFCEWKYHNKYFVSKNLDETSKKLVNKKFKKLLSGIKSKNIDEITQEIKQILKDVNAYRVPNKCKTCAKKYCEKYANGCTGCDKWE